MYRKSRGARARTSQVAAIGSVARHRSEFLRTERRHRCRRRHQSRLPSALMRSSFTLANVKRSVREHSGTWKRLVPIRAPLYVSRRRDDARTDLCVRRKVYKATLMTTQEIVAIKEVEIEEKFKSRELDVLKMMIHPNIVRLKYFFHPSSSSSTKNILCLIMEYMPMSAHRLISDYRRNHKILPLFYIKLFSYQMLRGLGYLHVQGVVSRYLYRSSGSSWLASSRHIVTSSQQT